MLNKEDNLVKIVKERNQARAMARTNSWSLLFLFHLRPTAKGKGTRDQGPSASQRTILADGQICPKALRALAPWQGWPKAGSWSLPSSSDTKQRDKQRVGLSVREEGDKNPATLGRFLLFHLSLTGSRFLDFCLSHPHLNRGKAEGQGK